MNIFELESKRKVLLEERDKVQKELNEKLNNIREEIAKVDGEIHLALNNVDSDKIALGQKILSIEFYTRYSCYVNDDSVYISPMNDELVIDAINDCIDDFSRLRKEYFGYKEYDGYYQRCDCDYGCGPTHGSIVESIGLKRDYRGDYEFSSEEKEACIYLLHNLDKLLPIVKEEETEKLRARRRRIC